MHAKLKTDAIANQTYIKLQSGAIDTFKFSQLRDKVIVIENDELHEQVSNIGAVPTTSLTAPNPSRLQRCAKLHASPWDRNNRIQGYKEYFVDHIVCQTGMNQA